MTRPRIVVPVALLTVSAFALAGCAGPSGSGDDAAGDGRLQVVASTNVYGQIAEEIGGDAVEVTSIVSSASQDPHSFEPSAQDQLAVSRADLIVENGGGYDAYIDALIESSGSEAPVVTAAEYSHDYPGNAGHDDEDAADDSGTDATAGATEEHSDDDHAEDGHADDGHDHDGHDHIEGFNEHVWYDPHTIEHVAEGIADELSALRPDDAATFAANAAAFAEGVAGIEASLADVEASDAGAAVFVTEPVPVYLVHAAGLENVTPEAFSEAVEEGQDVPPATLLESLQLLEDGSVRVVITNAQTGGAETTQIVDAAEAAGIPVIEFAETLPEGQTYLSWMDENVAALADALSQ